MDFDLFMERYGYKLLGVMVAILIILVIGFPLSILGKWFLENPYIAPIFVVLIFIQAFFKRKQLTAYGEAMSKYFYYDKKR
ncbi:hypothetical protein [Pyrococcus sp. ST04]|uniref:hypothetical protein n=1 Tax=Pyrococcus sp. ST04 TaxID=1183377 RepID=UPI0002605C2D|nr:hypothetical protein [Pyrococcus sp. ST04]AFK22353.1 hypothetical protein Py04_0752 [Pyrococcus sp. ST04]